MDKFGEYKAILECMDLKIVNVGNICCRLLGPTTAADILQLTNTLTTQAGGPTHTRVVLANDDLRIISRPEEDLFEELFQVTIVACVTQCDSMKK